MQQIIFNKGNTYTITDYPIEHEPSVFSKRYHIDGNYRNVLRVTILGRYVDVVSDFCDNASYYIRTFDSADTYTDYDMSKYSMAGDIIDHRGGKFTVYMAEPSEQDINNRNLNQIRDELVEYPDLMKKFPTIYPEWKIQHHAQGSIVQYNGELYQCVQTHSSTGDPSHTPDITPALWRRFFDDSETNDNTPREWVIGESVQTGDVRIYNGIAYECVQGHTTQAGWEPSGIPALWKAVA